MARKIFESDLWINKPSTWFKMWVYILGNVNFVDNGKFKRGQGYFDFKRERHMICKDISDDSTKKMLQYGRVNGLLSTKRSTRGVVVTVLNYDSYQSLESYTGTREGTNDALEKHQRSTPIHKNGKNGKNDKNTPCNFELIWSKYPKRLGRKNAERHFTATVKTEEDFLAIQKALENYLSSERVMNGFIQNGSTWFNQWQDWINFCEKVCEKCKNRGKYTSSTGYEIVCDCPRGKK